MKGLKDVSDEALVRATRRHYFSWDAAADELECTADDVRTRWATLDATLLDDAHADAPLADEPPPSGFNVLQDSLSDQFEELRATLRNRLPSIHTAGEPGSLSTAAAAPRAPAPSTSAILRRGGGRMGYAEAAHSSSSDDGDEEDWRIARRGIKARDTGVVHPIFAERRRVESASLTPTAESAAAAIMVTAAAEHPWREPPSLPAREPSSPPTTEPTSPPATESSPSPPLEPPEVVAARPRPLEWSDVALAADGAECMPSTYAPLPTSVQWVILGEADASSREGAARLHGATTAA